MFNHVLKSDAFRLVARILVVVLAVSAETLAGVQRASEVRSPGPPTRAHTPRLPETRACAAARVGSETARARKLPDVVQPTQPPGQPGSLDRSFGLAGTARESYPGPTDDGAHTIVFQPDGKLVVAGGSSAVENSALFAARFDATGRRDATFGGDGHVVADIEPGGTVSASAVAVQPADGKLLVTSYDYLGGRAENVAVTRFFGR